MNAKRTCTAIMAALLAACMLAACSGSPPATATESGAASATSATASQAAAAEPGASSSSAASGAPAGQAAPEGDAAAATAEFAYPADTDVTLRYWVILNSGVAAVAESVNELPFTEEEYKRTGIKIQYEHPPLGQELDMFNLMLASDDLPDMINAGGPINWSTISGGPDKMIDDGFIADLGELMEHAPNFQKLLDEDADVDRMVRTGGGRLYIFPNLKLDPILTVFYGPMVRGDWLEELDIPAPETMDDWHEMLVKFRDEKGAEAPLCYTGKIHDANGIFIGAYGVKNDFFLDGGTIKFGALEPGYKEFLEEYGKWYAEGLIEPNLPSIDGKAVDAIVLNDKAGATVGFNGSTLGRYLTAKAEEDPSFSLIPVRNPSLVRGTKAEFGQQDLPFSGANSVAISANSEHKELAMRFLDYAFSTEGNLFYNFGTEGESYTLVNGEPVYTDLILKNDEGLSISYALAKYTHSAYEGPYPMDVRYFPQIYVMPPQVEALTVWADHNGGAHLIPKFAMTPEESDEYATLWTDIKPYVDEMLLKFIMGVEPVSNYEAFVDMLNSMGIQRAIEIQQAGYDRYMS
ncbi:MAG: extracellular solute-binding protein [Clostridiales bacterium]|jgi:putative aldouronate transport system substrate-binding protein|nr:extracellular solute-binding protein [Clostridiales bacterium]